LTSQVGVSHWEGEKKNGKPKAEWRGTEGIRSSRGLVLMRWEGLLWRPEGSWIRLRGPAALSRATLTQPGGRSRGGDSAESRINLGQFESSRVVWGETNELDRDTNHREAQGGHTSSDGADRCLEALATKPWAGARRGASGPFEPEPRRGAGCPAAGARHPTSLWQSSRNRFLCKARKTQPHLIPRFPRESQNRNPTALVPKFPPTHLTLFVSVFVSRPRSGSQDRGQASF